MMKVYLYSGSFRSIRTIILPHNEIRNNLNNVIFMPDKPLYSKNRIII